MSNFLNRNVLLISFSAFFSDMGYQTVLAVLPVLLVLQFNAPVYVYGIIMGVSYGLGAFFGYIGGRLSDKYGRKKIAIIGNAFIPFLSLSGVATNFIQSSALFTTGWLSRNFRSPARKALLSDETNDATRGRVFGFLNALDVGGGVASITILLILLHLNVKLSDIILLTSIPIFVATILLIFIREKPRNVEEKSQKNVTPRAEIKRSTYNGVILATGLYGFSYYSLGFPILTIAKAQNDALGFASYLFFLLASALFGYVVGSRRIKLIPSLAFMGYILSGIGTLVLGLAYVYNLGVVVMFLAVVLIGMAIGTISTLEPNLITIVKPRSEHGRGMGALTSSRSAGLFFGNIVMGFLYVFDPFYSYLYATVVAMIAGLIILIPSRNFKDLI
ncbi:MAG: MFS transporter [Thermoplasmataceae archaeon]